jgi:hypothetical protein
MSVTELDEVEALLEKVLPDPTGFGRRLLLQVMARLGETAEANGGPSFADAKAFYTAAAAEDVTANDTFMAADPPAADDTPIDMKMLLAVALGACDCWGLRADCVLCQGHGSAGWTKPDPELFDEFIQPAVAKLAGEGSRDHHTAIGENA